MERGAALALCVSTSYSTYEMLEHQSLRLRTARCSAAVRKLTSLSAMEVRPVQGLVRRGRVEHVISSISSTFSSSATSCHLTSTNVGNQISSDRLYCLYTVHYVPMLAEYYKRLPHGCIPPWNRVHTGARSD